MVRLPAVGRLWLIFLTTRSVAQSEFSNRELDDLIIRRTDGSPTYNFCVVVDDWDINHHVIRGEDHINNTPARSTS